MTDKINLYGVVQPPTSIKPSAARPVNGGRLEVSRGGFEGFFQEEVAKGDLKFSAHAEKRLASRQIPLSPTELAGLKSAVDRAAAKGARESLVLMKDMAFIVSVKNRTVITAIDGQSLKENVFTNIDSAVIA